jgi:hypothetical protein
VCRVGVSLLQISGNDSKKRYLSAWGTGKLGDVYVQVYIFKIPSLEEFNLWVAGGKPKRGKQLSFPVQVPSPAMKPGETHAAATARLQASKPLLVGCSIL